MFLPNPETFRGNRIALPIAVERNLSTSDAESDLFIGYVEVHFVKEKTESGDFIWKVSA